ncbi:RNA-binding KH domain-containing protein RCF3 isoform X2 [Abrus precatorius]|uniref:RNA-binding KH domain-containing protein RCF3 isoform X2 n=1 Tax=Abrus precatorius TaxID=3816 RepID=A0A8B8LXE5_ABRPR|nr:RNA-binding KH domain-containing protein RCF3 isoform X2 [Abrus precatorius]XP_027359578.1 RNA-binding KH domain-containing protein RCF3 isoform X2 [Abrus precatorius]XP_027359579.1 RNA-binding KH domain-containing protein RCF3 isoform X2 [Abrus precatorius]XP_027359580.1 RNA-binding KH domain-containing protein RCF3 isoform X2 [Abrus precatorius]
MAGQRSGYGKRPHPQSDYDNGANKRRNHGDEREQFVIDPEDTVYRYLCPGRKIGSVIGRGGEIVKQLRVETKSKIRIGETVPGCEERVITIYSPSDETNAVEDGGNYVSPAQDALFKVHDRVVAEDLHGDQDDDGGHQVTAKLLVPSDQIGCVIGKGGQIVQNIRSETGAQIRILKDEHLPACALSSDELVQISGDAGVVKKALYQIASRLHDNPSRSQHLLTSAVPGVYPAGGSLIGPTAGAPIVGIAPLVGAYGGYKGDAGDWPRSMYSAPRDEASSKEFSVRLVCPTGNIGGVIGKGGVIINQIRQDSGATIKVDSSAAEGDECLINISTKEFFEDTFSPTIEAAVRLQPRCSEKVERDSGIISFTTRLLVSTSRIGCLIGKGGSIITEMRRLTKANIRIISKENLPKIASDDDEMVQISGDLDIAKDALVHVLTRLRANLFDREGALSAFLPVLPYLPVSADGSDGLNYDSRDGKRHGRGHSYSSGYGGSSDLAAGDIYGSYGGSQLGSSGAYGAYGSYSLGRSSTAGLSSQSSLSRRRNHAY